MNVIGESILVWNVVVCYQKDCLSKSPSAATRDLLSANNTHLPHFIMNYIWMSLLQPVTEAQLQY
jgi:hypothetical protein